MIYQANHRSDKMKGDPKIGGHSLASSSALHILGALHLVVKTGFDHIANKPHASPADHSYNYLLDLFFKPDGTRFTQDEKNIAMKGLRAYPTEEQPFVFQSYHSTYDADHHNFFPSGTVGIPPVNAGYLALAYRFAKDHGYNVPDAHFWCLIGDSEFREGSLFEATPDFAERELGALTWIVDYNRQSLDGHRIINREIMNGTDADRIERTMAANGWEVIQVRHGQKREKLFKSKNGDAFKNFLEKELDDYTLQALLLMKDPKALAKEMTSRFSQLKAFLKDVSDTDLYEALRDFGGHDIQLLTEAFEKSKKSTRRPTIVIAHTLKGWGLDMAASQGNHSALPDEEEMIALQKKQGLKDMFGGFEASTPEGAYLKKRGESLYKDMQAQKALKEKNWNDFQTRIQQGEGIPDSLNINLKMANYPHTQWMLGQCTAKLTRIANTLKNDPKAKELNEEELRWKLPAEMLTTMAPDVGTSTNLNPAMDGKIFGAPKVEDVETQMGVKDSKSPDLVPGEENSDRFIRFEIVEANTTSCAGSYGRLRDILGIPILPLMTVYDFFVKRALDQHFYNLYWKSSFILVGTPSGVTLSPEGAQHGWKSDLQIPNQITWEPAFCQELDWILSESIRLHMTGQNEGRTGVHIRGVTRGIDQKMLINNFKKQKRFKTEDALLHPTGFPLEGATDESQVPSLDEANIFATLRQDVLAGAYYLIDYRGYANYEPGDNVVNIFCMGALVTEAVAASEALLQQGIYGNVIVVTSSDLLCGQLAHNDDYAYLKNGLGINGNITLSPALNGHSTVGELITLSGRRVPIVSVHDGEPGLLDNIGSIVGVRHESLAVRKHSKCGRPVEIYHYHKIDSDAIIEATHKVLDETAMESVQVSTAVVQQLLTPSSAAQGSDEQSWSHNTWNKN
ncbi:MAG: pyruvate dehydrogenase [Bdellovibrionales bacterium]|nr:pyruvate dehydrogenase [Bdellovibrionales bacterium]